jgi:predicted unusual protein kinase regulating ubiquinone biosynthesis (AarF/ABC1/UbiB family)
MYATDAIGGAVRETLQEILETGDFSVRTGIDAVLARVADASSEIEPGEGIINDIGFALLNHEAPEEERRAALQRGIHTVINNAIGSANYLGLATEGLLEQAKSDADAILGGVADFAGEYPNKTDLSAMTTIWRKTANPNKANTEEAVVAAFVGYELLAPYISKRLLEINFTDRDALAEKTRELIEDGVLFAGLFEATRHLVGAAEDGYSTKNPKEIAEDLFSVGPLMTKIGQMLTSANLAFPDDKAEFIEDIGKHLQEGVAMPNIEELEALADILPERVTVIKALSSASIGYVLDARMDDGREVVVKVARPDTREAIKQNARVLSILTDMTIALISDQAGEDAEALKSKLQLLAEGLPFLLDVLVDETNAELDFMAEAASQTDAHERFKGTETIVPEVIEATPEYIIMGRVPGERIDESPGNQQRLINLASFLIQSLVDGKVHGDMHGGNVKSNETGEIIVYDWGHVEVNARFMMNAARYMVAAKRKNPKAMAKAYEAIQHEDYVQLRVDEIESIAREAVDAIENSGESNVNSVFFLALAMRHQSTIDIGYGVFSRSIGNYANLFKQEISKDDYGNGTRKIYTVSKSIARAVRDIWSQKRKKQSPDGPLLLVQQESDRM